MATDDEVVTPHANDVLLGRGSFYTLWQGNVYFRQIISQYRVEYKDALRFFKTNIAFKVKHVISSLNPPGRFLKKNNNKKGGVYNVVSCDQAIEKICQALREKVIETTKSNANSSTTSTNVVIGNKANAPRSIAKKRVPLSIPKKRSSLSYQESYTKEICQNAMNDKLLRVSKSIARKPAISRDDIFFSPTNRVDNSNKTQSNRFSYAMITPGEDLKEHKRGNPKTLSNSVVSNNKGFSDKNDESTTPRRAFISHQESHLNEICQYAMKNKLLRDSKLIARKPAISRDDIFFSPTNRVDTSNNTRSNRLSRAMITPGDDLKENNRGNAKTLSNSITSNNRGFSDKNYESTTPRRAFNEISPFAAQKPSHPPNKSIESIGANRYKYENETISNFTGSSFTRRFASIEDVNQKLSPKDRLEYDREGNAPNAYVDYDRKVFKVSKTETSLFENDILAHNSLQDNRSSGNSTHHYYNHENENQFQTKQASSVRMEVKHPNLEPPRLYYDSMSLARNIYSNQQESWNSIGSFMNHDGESFANTSRSYSSFDRSSPFQPIYEHRYLAAPAAGAQCNVPSRDVIQNSISPLTINSNSGDENVVSEQQRQTFYCLSESQSLGCTPLSWLGPSVGGTENVLNSFSSYCEDDKELTETDTDMPPDVLRTV